MIVIRNIDVAYIIFFLNIKLKYSIVKAKQRNNHNDGNIMKYMIWYVFQKISKSIYAWELLAYLPVLFEKDTSLPSICMHKSEVVYVDNKFQSTILKSRFLNVWSSGKGINRSKALLFFSTSTKWRDQKS